MTIKLPIILSAMIAALAVPNALASQAGSEPAKEEAAATEAMPAEAAATEAAPAEAAPAPAKKGGKKKHHGKKHHKAHHGGGSSASSPEAGYKKAWDQGVPEVDGDASRDLSPKAGQMEQPGQKTP